MLRMEVESVKRKLWLPIVLMALCASLAACQNAGAPRGEGQNSESENLEVSSQGMSGKEAEEPEEAEEPKRETASAGKSEKSVLDEAPDWQNVKVPEHEILLVIRMTNMAWGYQDSGYFIDTDGCVYEFNFSGSPVGMIDGESVEFVDRLKAIREDTESEVVFDADFVKQISALGANLSADDEFDKISMRRDYGQRTLYFYQPETKELLRCESTGDYDYLPMNKSAKKIVALLEEVIRATVEEIK